MRFTLAAIAFYATYVLAQTGQNAISIPQGQSTLDITAGQQTTIQWTAPSAGDVTILLQYAGNDQLADSGITLASGIPASAQEASFTIPADAVTSGTDYTIVIVDDTTPINRNYAPAFTVAGADGTASLPTGGATATSGSASTRTGSATTDSTDSTITSATSSDSSSETSSATSSRSSASRTSSSSASSTASATEAPSSNNGAGSLTVAGGLAGFVAAVAALL